MSFKFENIEQYFPENPRFGTGAMYFRDSLGRDWYTESWGTPKGTPAVMVDDTTGYVRGYTESLPDKPLSIVVGCSVYQVEELPDMSTWDWFYDSDSGLHQKESEESKPEEGAL